MQSDFAKSDGIKSNLRIRWLKSSDFGPKSDDSTHRIIKSKNGIRLYSSKNLTINKQSRAGTAAVRGTYKSTSSDRCVGLRIPPRCANAVAAPLCGQTAAVCRRGLGPRDQEEQRTPHASFVTTYHSRVHTAAAAAVSCRGLGCLVETKAK